MPGFSANIINLISDNLRDRYQSGFPILKELIQNADDAPARRFVFGDHIGFDEAHHPLLQGPGLFFFNDGSFRESDKKAISSFAENSKAGEEGTIGKFGLGMKSVFHLCEAFFYLAYNGSSHSSILNPWDTADGNLHPEWETVTQQDWERLANVTKDLIEDSKSWFFLWIPLRKKDHLRNGNGPTGSIIERFPGDPGNSDDLSFLADDSLVSTLAAIMPLLDTVEVIEFRSSKPSKGFVLNLKAEERLKRDAIGANSTGEVLHDLSNPLLFFHGKKRYGMEPIFHDLKEHPKWPKTFCRDANGHPKEARDKSKPEGAVVISCENRRSGLLSIQWSLFLPLDEQTHVFEAAMKGCSKRYQIYVHGQFFVDAGRRGIFEYSRLHASSNEALGDLDEAGLRRRWNQEVAQKASLALFLPTFAEFVKANALSDDDIRLLTEAVCNATVRNAGDATGFVSRFKQAICESHSWIRVIKPDGLSWQIIPNVSALKILPVPSPPKTDPGRPWLVFPNLVQLSDMALLVDGDAPAISTRVKRWSEDELLAVLNRDTSNSFAGSTTLGYLAEFLEHCASTYIGTERLQRAIIVIVLDAFRRFSLVELRKNRLKVSRIVGFISPQYRLAIGTSDPNAAKAVPETIFKGVWSHDSRVLVVPMDLDDPDAPGKARPSKEEAGGWLRLVHKHILGLQEGDSKVEKALEAATQILDTLDDSERTRLLNVQSDMRVIPAIEPLSGRTVAVSFGMLEDARQRENIFGFSQNLQQPTGLTPLLAEVLPEESIYVLKAIVHRTLFGGATIPASTAGAAILRSIGITMKTLGPENKRYALVDQADDPGQDAIAKRGLRYLLHGDPTHFSDQATPLWVAQRQESPAWEKLWRQVSGTEGRDCWNVLKKNVAERVHQNRWDSIGIRVIHRSEVIAELRRVGAQVIIPEQFADLDCEEILSAVDDKSLWQSLPFHLMKKGDKGPIDDHVYLDIGNKLPIELTSVVTVAVLSTNILLAQKQQEWILPLDQKAILWLLLKEHEAVRHWRTIADTMANTSSTHLAAIPSLRKVNWLPLQTGGSISPQDVIDLPLLEDQVQLLAAQTNYSFAGVADLDHEVLNHKVFGTLRTSCFAKGRDALAPLGLLMSEVGEYAIGMIEIPREERLIQMLPVLAQVQALPAWKIVDEVVTKFGAETCIDLLIPQVSRPISQEKVVEILNLLAERASKRNQGVESAFELYLRLFCADQNTAKSNLPQLKLRSQGGEWRSANDLCVGAVDISERFVLDAGQASILSTVLTDAGLSCERRSSTLGFADIDLALQAAPENLKLYFEKWTGLVREEPIGALLCLLGRRNRDLAQHYLGGLSFDGLIEQIGWKVPNTIDQWGRRDWMYGMSADEAFNALEVAVRTVNDNEVLLKSITALEIRVPLSDKITSIIAGAPWWGGGYKVYLPLRKFPVGDFTPDELSSLLRGTSEYLLDKCYNQRNPNLCHLWQELDKSDQLEIEVARGKILNHLPFYLRQLNAHHKSEPLRQALDAYDNAVERLEEFKLSTAFTAEKLKKLSSDVDVKRENLARLFSEDEAAQVAVLEAVRIKLAEFQYSTDCVPFELFQNADDAVTELGRFEVDDDGDTPLSAKKVVIEGDGCTLRFMHWGRVVNAPGPLAANAGTYGYRRDLEKMVVLSSSDKPIAEGVTGKFGLGFKSVFLCCDRPRILSGSLRVEIVGGVLPQLWTTAQDAAARLVALTENRRYRGTVTELQLNAEITEFALLDRFEKLAGLLCVFGRTVRRIEIWKSGDPRPFDWDAVPLGSDVEIGTCTLWRSGGWTTEKCLVFRGEHGTVLFNLSPKGFSSLPEDIPSIWVTAPTQEPDCLGFAMSSACFAVDAGRGKLASDLGRNLQLAQTLGRQTGAALVKLMARLDSDWSLGKNQLVLADSTSMAGLLASLWRTLSRAILSKPQQSGAATICRGFALKVLEKVRYLGIPNGLPYPFERLIPLEDLKFELAGAWGRREAIEWLGHKEIDVGHCVMNDIAVLLRNLNLGASIVKISFPLLFTPLPKGRCQNEDAECFENIARILWADLPEDERSDASVEMEKLIFQNRAGQWVELRFLLCSGVGDKDEDLRVAFAPDSFLLHESYNELGKAFFKRCRARYEAPTDTLAGWVVRAESDAKRQAALLYLRFGDLGRNVCERLRDQSLVGTWLAEIYAEHIYLKHWDAKDRAELLRILSENITFAQTFTPPPEPKIVINTKETLVAIFDWWQREGHFHAAAYEHSLYPGGHFPRLEYDFLKREPEARKGWLTLFLLGACHTKGRTMPQQHRAFVEHCLSKGWMDTFVSVTDEGVDGWMTILKEYLQTGIHQLDRYHWMREFVSIFLLSYWLDDYVEGFLAVNRIHEDFDLSHITRMKASHHFEGGGVEAPPVSQALGMGASFVVRELTRKGFIKNKFAYPHCYVPKGAVRTFLTRLGCDGLETQPDHGTCSKVIYQFLVDTMGPEKATFGNSFDLPILAVANDASLQHRLFHRTILTPDEIYEDENGE